MGKGILLKLFAFTLAFSFLFFLVKVGRFIPTQSSDDASSLGWLFSVAGVIFGVLSGFVIQMKWNIWDKLVEAAHGERTSIRQLHSLIHHLPTKTCNQIKYLLKDYLKLTILETNDPLALEVGSGAENALIDLEKSIYKLYEDEKITGIDSIAYELFRKIMNWREARINYSQERLLPIIRFFILGNAGVIILLSLLLPVASLFLDYVFTLSIALLSYSIYLLIDDLDNPFRPGNWHLSSNGYTQLLEELMGH